MARRGDGIHKRRDGRWEGRYAAGRKPDGSILILGTPKTADSFRDLPIPVPLIPLLLQRKSNAVSEYVISDKADFMSPRTLDFKFQNLLKQAGLSHINYHGLRHTFATRCIEAGVDVKSLSELLGHSNAAITLNTYVHSSMDNKKRQLEKMSAMLSVG